METITLHNTLSGKKETFQPLEKGKVTMYSCGPTVYGYATIGNFRSFLFSDLLNRVFRYAGYKVTKVMNITDVGHLTNDDMADGDGEDKIAKKALREKKDPFDVARMFEEAFIEDEKKLRILPPDHRPRATDYIQEQIELAQKLIDEGYAYESNGSVYFETRKFKDYGKLSKNNIEDLNAGARVEVHTDKKDPLDFALWKKADKSHLMQWDSPWGRGFPGWHIECSAMSKKLLGDQFDIHTGGEDNIFPHHECEIAQNECSCGGKKSVNYWLHGKHLMVEGQKMSKSKGNFYTIQDLINEGWKGEEIRYALLAGHYRTSLNFSKDLLQQARSSISRIREAYRIFGALAETKNDEPFVDSYRKKYQTALFDDLNVSDALSVVFDLIKKGMKLRDTESLTVEQACSIFSFLEQDFNCIFDVLDSDEDTSSLDEIAIEQLIADRAQARADKNWTEADRIRDFAAEKYNIEFVDEMGKTTWRMK